MAERLERLNRYLQTKAGNCQLAGTTKHQAIVQALAAKAICACLKPWRRTQEFLAKETLIVQILPLQ